MSISGKVPACLLPLCRALLACSHVCFSCSSEDNYSQPICNTNTAAQRSVLRNTGLVECRKSPRKITLTSLSGSLCPLHISRSDAPIVPRCCRLSQCEWVPNPALAVGASSGDHREVVSRSGAERVQCSCLSEGVVINKTPSPYQPTRMYAVRAIRLM